MGTFVQGTIVEQKGCYGDYYEMKLRLATGQVIPLNYTNERHFFEGVREEHDPISDLLELGASYELLTVLGLRHLTYSSTIPLGTTFKIETKMFQSREGVIRRNEVRQAKVLDPDWHISNLELLALSNASSYKQRYALVETAIGNVLINYRDIQFELGEQQLAAGGYLEWQRGGLILLAIIAKHSPLYAPVFDNAPAISIKEQLEA